MKIGVYIGSFNPVHVMHESIVNILLKEKTVDKIVIIPTNSSYNLKKGLAPYEDRFKMLELAFQNQNVIISDLEKTKYNFTYQNINLLKEKYLYDELYLILGADNLFQFNTWQNYEEILKKCHLIIIGRDNLDMRVYINNNFTNYKLKFIVKDPVGELSSTLIRDRINNGYEVENYLSDSVKEYISKNNLYKGDVYNDHTIR